MENKGLYELIGKRLRQLRQERRLTIRETARRLGRSRDFVLDAGVARYRIPLDKLYEYCAVLDVRLKDVIPDFIPGSTTELYNSLKD